MPQSHAQVWIHVVFSTKNRIPYFQNKTFRTEMFRMLSYHVKELKCVSASIGGYDDHIHLLARLTRTITIAQLVEKVKTETSKWAKRAKDGNPAFTWQAGYGAFSVSHSLCNTVDEYIRHQARHHIRMSIDDFAKNTVLKSMNAMFGINILLENALQTLNIIQMPGPLVLTIKWHILSQPVGLG